MALRWIHPVVLGALLFHTAAPEAADGGSPNELPGSRLQAEVISTSAPAMRIERRKIDCSPHGAVSAVMASLADIGSGAKVGVILAHGAGNDMDHPLISGVHEGLARRGFLSVKFNFPYKERGGRMPDPAWVLETCYRAVVDTVRGDLGIAPAALVIGGKSLGGRTASHLAAQGLPVDGLLFLGYPLHPAGRPDKLRAAHLGEISAPMLFISGTRDSLCSMEMLQPVLKSLPRAHLHLIEGADHSFRVPKSAARTSDSITRELVEASVDWIETSVRAGEGGA